MSFDFVIQIKNLSKCYQIYDCPSDRLKQSIYSGLHRLFGKKTKPLFREFWALRDVSFEIAKGESVGIIGQNGSGKSTLLQLIYGTLNPTSGSVKTYGRIAALLELGSGFNPEFSGRENVYMNGAVLGLTKTEINERFDEIVSFADIAEFIDQPTKTYSNGMFVRLAFAVQVCVEPDILVVDEALAVGDALFQKRCFERMDRLRTNGTTLLFVSHDQESVRTMTDKAIFLEHGIVKFTGTSADALLEYRKSLHEIESKRLSQAALHLKEKTPKMKVAKQKSGQQIEQGKVKILNTNDSIISANNKNSPILSERFKAFSFGDLDAEVLDVSLFNEKGEPCFDFDPRDKITVIVKCKAHTDLTHLNVGLRIRNKEGVKMYSWGTLNQDIAILNGANGDTVSGAIFWRRNFSQNQLFGIKFEFICGMGPNLYEIQVSITEEYKPYYAAQRMIHWIDEAAFFSVNTKPQSYHFGGVVDLRMISNLL